MVVEYMDRAQGPKVDCFAQNLPVTSFPEANVPHERPSWPWRPYMYGGHAPGVTRAMATHGRAEEGTVPMG